MAVKVLLQLKGDSTGATTAVDEAETALTGTRHRRRLE